MILAKIYVKVENTVIYFLTLLIVLLWFMQYFIPMDLGKANELLGFVEKGFKVCKSEGHKTTLREFYC